MQAYDNLAVRTHALSLVITRAYKLLQRRGHATLLRYFDNNITLATDHAHNLLSIRPFQGSKQDAVTIYSTISHMLHYDSY